MKKSSKTDMLFLADYYLPGKNAGGPIKSLSNLFEIIGKHFNITLLTRDRDFKSATTYSQQEIKITQSQQVINIHYLATNFLGYWKIFRQIKKNESDKIFLNSLFSVPFSIFPLLLYFFKFYKTSTIYLAPRGELADSALNYSSLQKRLYLTFLKNSGLIKKIKWVACSEHELKSIRDFTNRTDIIMLPNIGMLPLTSVKTLETPAQLKTLKIIFYSRISPIKNVLFIYEVLKKIRFNVVLDLYGPITDQPYWEECQKMRDTLPKNIQVTYHEVIDLDQFKMIVQNYHVMFLPTQGENFGQAIYECLACGRPVLISDQTPWRRLAELQAGFDLSLQSPQQFVSALHQIIDMDESQLSQFFQGSLDLAKNYFATHVDADKIVKLF